MNTMPSITVFTPTFNRAHTLHRVFNSLLGQQYMDFEWVIVDDGSTDETRDIVAQFIRQEPFFKIYYFFQPNSGKHIAINRGAEMAKGKWFHIADSDDALEPRTLAVFMKTWEEIPLAKRHLFCGVAACCKDQYGNRISDQVPGGMFDGGFRELFYKYHFRKEVFMINKTAIIRQFPFPEFIRNCYFPESTVWRKMTDQYLIRFINDEMRIYYINDQHSIMSGKKAPALKALSNCIGSSDVLNHDLKYFFYYPFYFCKMAVVYHSFLPFLNKNQREWVSLQPAARVFALCFIFAGWCYHKVLLSGQKQ